MERYFELPWDRELAARVVRDADQLFTFEELTGVSAFVDNRQSTRRVVLAFVFDTVDEGKVLSFDEFVVKAGGTRIETDHGKLLKETQQGAWNAMIGNCDEWTFPRLFVDGIPDKN
jgi:hypothetical protein